MSAAYAAPTVSVIMPVFNLAPVVGIAIESVLTQTLDELELIVVDDASTDGTADVIEEYRRADPRVRVVHNATNSRASKIQWEPRNNGLQLATGDFIAYLDADNVWDTKALEVMSSALTECPEIQLVYCQSRNFHAPRDIDAVIAADARTVTQRGVDWVVFAHDDLDVRELGRTQYIDTNEMMHRATVFDTLGSLWHTHHPRRAYVNAHQGKRIRTRRHNDLDLAQRVIAAYGPESALQIPEVLVYYYYPSAPRMPRYVTGQAAWR